MRFRDRADAGRRLAERLGSLRAGDVVVLGLPRGGVPVAYEVARALSAPLDVLVVRKVPVPWQPEYAMGAVGEDGASVVNMAALRVGGISPEQLAAAQEAARGEVERLVSALRGGRARVPVAGRTAVVVDDGIATGATARAACQVLREQGAGRIVLATPVAPAEAVPALAAVADEVVCVHQPYDFRAVGRFYVDFNPTEEAEVVALLQRAAS
jgi:putative phosphoribosyl transferase